MNGKSGKAARCTAWYMLRRNLPIWKAPQAIKETIAFSLEVGIDEIAWKMDPEEFNHGFTPIETIRGFIPWLEKAREVQSNNGIVFSINPWLTLNHIGRCRYLGGPPPGFHWRVKPDGTEALEMACPLSPGWREWIFEAYQLYASVKPHKLWVEDDFRTFAHHTCELGCFCAEHLKAFSRVIGEEIGRDELVARITQPDEPDPIRIRWLDFQGEIMVEVCRRLEELVHQESPGTRIGLMNSTSTDGRWWEDAILALAGPHMPLARTSLAPYSEGRAIEFLPDRFDILKETACLPPDTENLPELESSTYTPYVKSARTSRLQLVLAQVLGNRGIAMNLFDMMGSPMSDDPRIGQMLRDTKPLLNGIASATGPGGTLRGVAIPFSKRYADTMQAVQGQGFDIFRFDGDGWCAPLQGSGIPIVFGEECRVSAATGQSLRALGKDEIEQLLREGLLLDGSAAAVLADLGYADKIGVEPGSPVERGEILLSAERDDWTERDDKGKQIYMSLRNVTDYGSGRIRPLRLLASAQAVSSFVDPNRQSVMHGMTVFENSWGGRVAVYPFDLSTGTAIGFMSWRRRRQLQRVVRWLCRDVIDLFVDGGAWMMPVRRDYPGYTFVAVLNFETDPWDEVTLTLGRVTGTETVRFELMDDTGVFQDINPPTEYLGQDNLRIRLTCSVPSLDFLALRVVYAD